MRQRINKINQLWMDGLQSEKLSLSETDEKVYYFWFHFTAKYIFMTWGRYSDFLSYKSLDNGDTTFMELKKGLLFQPGHCTLQRQDFFLFFFYFFKLEKLCWGRLIFFLGLLKLKISTSIFMFIALFTKPKWWKQLKWLSIDKWINKM